MRKLTLILRSAICPQPGRLGRWLAALLIVALLAGTGGVWRLTYAQGTAAMSFVLSSSSLAGCGTITVDLYVSDLVNAQAGDLFVYFDATRLEAIDGDLTYPGINLTPITTFMDSGFVIRNQVDNTVGTAWYAFTQLAPMGPSTGSGAVARLTLRARGAGPADIWYTRAEFGTPDGELIIATLATTTVTAVPPVAPSLSISRQPASTARLAWTASASAGIANYSLYRDTTPYFTPSDAQRITTSSGLSYDDVGILGNVNVQNYYTLRANCPNGFQSNNTNRVGEYDWALRSVSASNLSDISMVLTNPSLLRASDLAAYIGPSVKGIRRFDPATQSFVAFNPALPSIRNFFLSAGQFLFIETDTTAPASFSLVGNVPAPGAVQFSLTASTPARSNYVSLPLDQPSLDRALKVANSVGAGVVSVWKFDATTQSFIVYTPPSLVRNFPLVIGEPFVLSLTTGAPAFWP